MTAADFRKAEQLMWPTVAMEGITGGHAVTPKEAFRAGQELFPGHRVLVVPKDDGTGLAAD